MHIIKQIQYLQDLPTKNEKKLEALRLDLIRQSSFTGKIAIVERISEVKMDLVGTGRYKYYEAGKM